jgi:hypothetical protein
MKFTNKQLVVVLITIIFVVTAILAIISAKGNWKIFPDSLDTDKTTTQIPTARKKVRYYPENGVYESPKEVSSAYNLKQFTLQLPQGWMVADEIVDNKSFRVDFEKEDLHLSVTVPSSSFVCIFPEYNNNGEFGYIEVEHDKYLYTNFGNYRVAKRKDLYSITYNLCDDIRETGEFSNSPWLSVTDIGGVAYSTGFDNNEAATEIESIIYSVEIIK